MKLKLENPANFTKSIELISELVMEVRLKVNEFGMSIVAIDPANVAMVNFRLPKSAFSEFEVEEETLGVNLENFKKILKRVGKTGSLIIQRNENMLEIKIEDKIRRTFTLGLIEIEREDKEFPSHLEFSSKVELDSSDFIDAVEDCSIVSDACSFEIKENKFILEAKELNSARAEFSSDIVTIEAEDCKSRYSLEYLQKFMKAGKVSPRTTLNFANDHPLKIDFKLDDVSLSFLLAPRMEIED